jgi:hypothetical protein
MTRWKQAVAATLMLGGCAAVEHKPRTELPD